MCRLTHPVLPLMLALSLCSPFLVAQKGGGGGGGGSKGGSGAAPASNPTVPFSHDPEPTGNYFDPYRIIMPYSPDPHLKDEQPSCFKWPLAPVVSGVVSVDRLNVPAPARESFRAACSSVVKKEFPYAQRELNLAVKSLPKFAAAWALLGQIQRDEKRMDQAQQSCTEARNADASYLPAYLCLADLAARQNNWARTAELSSQALALQPVRAPGAYYLNALGSFYLGQMPQAEKSALRALDEGGPEQKPPLHWLLAKIYEANGDRGAEAGQLREYLKVAPHAQDAPLARKILQEIESKGIIPSSTPAKPPG